MGHAGRGSALPPSSLLLAAGALVLSGCVPLDDPPGGPRGDGAVEILQTEDPHVPTAEAALPDGRTLRVNAGEVSLHQDVSVGLHPVEDAEGGRQVVVVSSASDVLVSARTRALMADDAAADDVALNVRALTRRAGGDGVHELPPAEPAVLVTAEDPATLFEVPEGTQILCLELIDRDPAPDRYLGGMLGHPGEVLEVRTRAAGRELQLACGQAGEEAESFQRHRWAAERLGLDLPEEAPAPASGASVTRETGSAAEEVRLSVRNRGTESFEVRAPEGLETMVFVLGEGVWMWSSSADPVAVAPGETQELTVPLEEGWGDIAASAEICLEFQEPGQAPTQWCHPGQ